ncbi:Mitogen-activated protein kinase kinase protein [Dioscorea alata]|uniref:Mitogen-activated protein kinase kinase protein n=5 Tax=Dioscorea alata TaxID=55571 RepID=A0ACB7W600_DIOAL|nr:Mitogen-activated protein kinase kinase protein [Dioscorea alata]KAH7682842.1 Mitogen-activated protein kinase kinase protein [Dioscorea alata]KAH7682843.1 Mitogen-activated protein kinase kinase protein [Dioscorea alata]KAH7682844.1 Mitogen-activated protein kinase kinase protein [Dioscorea alata]KAH7682845.1 Mitogen-activated protein kinase kinase protein [Dioscorea alata]
MAGLEELKKKLEPLFDAEKGLSYGTVMDPSESYMVSDGGTVNLLSKSCGVYNVNELGFQKRQAELVEEPENSEKVYRCSSQEMHIFGTIGSGASSVVQRAIHMTIHRILALKKINVFEKEKRQQLLNEMRTLCDACCYQGLVEFHGAFYTPDTGQVSIVLEYMDGGSLADVLRLQRSIPEHILSRMLPRLFGALSYLHKVRHLVHRDIKPANLLINLKGEPKITDFGISAGLDSSVAMCATFVGTVTYMSPERIRSENYSYPADIWSLGLTLLECATGKYPYTANDGPANLMLQILYDPSPSPPRHLFSPEFGSFIDSCLQKDPEARPTADDLLEHPFLRKYGNSDEELAAYARKVFDPTKRLKEMADMLAVHYYLLFDGGDEIWHHMKSFYNEASTFSFSGKLFAGSDDIFRALSDIRKKLAGDRPCEKLVHVVEKLHCRALENDGIGIRASGSFIIGDQFLICGDGVRAEGMPSFDELSIDLASKRMGTFHEQFSLIPGSGIGTFVIAKQELYILKP